MRNLLAGASALALAACGDAAPAAGWRIDTNPLVAIGGVAGDSMRDLSRVAGAARLGDGSLVIANGGTDELRWFDASGQPVARTAQGDSLPGMTALYHRGDTVFVWDARSRRLSSWGPHGAYHGTREVQLPGPPRSVGLRGLLDSGALLVESAAPLHVPDSGRVIRSPSALFRLPAAGPAESIGTMMGDEFFVMREGGRASLLRLPFGAVVQVVAGPSGYLVSDDVAGGIALHAPGGALTGTASTPPRLPVWPADRERLQRLMLGSARSGREIEAINRVWAMMPIPDSFPSVTGLVGDPGALAWVRQASHLGDSLATWHVLGTGGRELGVVQLPARATPLEIGGDYVLLLVPDADAIERVHLHRLHRGGMTER